LPVLPHLPKLIVRDTGLHSHALLYLHSLPGDSSSLGASSSIHTLTTSTCFPSLTLCSEPTWNIHLPAHHLCLEFPQAS
jgi:hypothetical protein